MATKKTYKPKVEGYVPEALDGDGDGMVQDGTEFERPVGTEIDELVEVIEIVEPVMQQATPEGTVTLGEGENIITIAKRHCPEGQTWQDYAKTLSRLNGTVTPGQVIRLG